ncbi:MAG: iron ABC transporter permease [Spirochaetia bacterium]|nr:iron ABC transporter permease [Spirochaetia bacterium]
MKKRTVSHKNNVSLSFSLLAGMGILIPLFFLPVGFILFKGFTGEGSGFSFSLLREQLSSPYIWRITYFTLKQAFWSTVLSLLIALPGAYLLSHFSFFGKKLLKSLSVIPFVLPPILVVLGFVIFYGNSGYINRFLMNLFDLSDPPLHILYSFKAIILAHSFYNFPIILRVVSSYWEGLSDTEEKAAYSLGAKRIRVFFTVTLPRLIPSIISSASIVFLFCFTSFAVILVLGGGPQFTTLEVEIYRQARISFNLDTAAVLTIISLVFSITIFLFHQHIQHRYTAAGNTVSVLRESPSLMSLGQKGKRFLYLPIMLYSALAVFFLLAPIISVIITSFQVPIHRTQEVTYSLKWYRSLFSSAYGGPAIISGSARSIINSFTIASASMLVTTFITLLLSFSSARMSKTYSRILEIISMLPMMVSSVILGLGYFLIAKEMQKVGFSSPRIMIIGAHVVITFPFLYKTITPVFKEIHKTYSPASYVLGAAPLKTILKVELPILRSTLISGMIFIFAISMGEFNAALILSNSQVETIPITMYRLIGSYNFYGACALGTILMVSSLGIFYFFDTARKRTSPEISSSSVGDVF